MGISGLLPFLEDASRPCHVSDFRSCTVAVDSYCWLHRGSNTCVEQLAMKQDTDLYVKFCLKFVQLLLNFKIHVIMVFDGKSLPAKSETERTRRENRQKAQKRAAELMNLGQQEEARKYMRQSINITPEMAFKLIKECRKLGVDCIVAPYESDAQLAYFSLNNIADVIISEDSDLLVFGCKKVFYKMDLNGHGRLVENNDNFHRVMKIRPDNYTFDKFRNMCILSGCDYLPSLPGIGLKKALKFMQLTMESDPQRFLEMIPKYLKMKNLTITTEYKTNFFKAIATFQHQTVFDPFEKKLKPLTDPRLTGTLLENCCNVGDLYDDAIALQVALGNLHPENFSKFDDWSPDKSIFNGNSIWGKLENVEPKIVKKDLKFKPPASCTEQEDELIQKNLDFYKNISPVKENYVQIEDKSPSPILTKTRINPFQVKKKLSKFPLTTLDNTVVVKSRFFAPKTVVKEEDKTIVEDNIKDEEIEIKEVKEESSTKCNFKEFKKDNKSLVVNRKPILRLGLKRKASQQTLTTLFSKMQKTNV